MYIFRLNLMVVLSSALLFASACTSDEGNNDNDEENDDAAVVCQSDEDCEEGQLCLDPPTTEGECVFSCISNESEDMCESVNCVLRYESNGSELLCMTGDIPCSNDQECPPSILCNEGTGLCDSALECSADIDCPLLDENGEELSCFEGQCVTDEERDGSSDAGVDDAG